jgi:hypothetical protein
LSKEDLLMVDVGGNLVAAYVERERVESVTLVRVT